MLALWLSSGGKSRPMTKLVRPASVTAAPALTRAAANKAKASAPLWSVAGRKELGRAFKFRITNWALATRIGEISAKNFPAWSFKDLHQPTE
jgi:hypothetical protein